MKTPIAFLLSLLTSFAFAQQTGLPTAHLSVAGKQITAEVASSPKQREIGLMFRKSMPSNDGMLFIFDDIREVCMWMQNTLIPLSVAFIGGDGTIVNIAEMKPQTTTLHCSAVPIQYALEMNQGWFKKNNIKPGAKFANWPPLKN